MTEEGRKNQVASRLSFGVRSNIPVLAGIEDPLEWASLRKGMFEVWNPVGMHAQECVDQIADGYWRLRRIRRCLTETTLTQLYAAAVDEPEEVRAEITRLLGEPVIRQSVFGRLENGDTESNAVPGNGNGECFAPTLRWWEKILSAPDSAYLSHTEARLPGAAAWAPCGVF